MNELKPHEWQILADILTLAAEEFSNNGCNDYEIADTPENRQFVTMIEADGLTPEELEDWSIYSYKGEIITGDTTLMRHFARYARQRANKPSRESIAVDLLSRLVHNNPYDGMRDFCFFCGKYDNEPHMNECPHIESKCFLSEVAPK